MTTAEQIMDTLIRQAILDCLKSPTKVIADRIYTADSGVVIARASYDFPEVKVKWLLQKYNNGIAEVIPFNRAKDMIALRVARTCAT